MKCSRCLQNESLVPGGIEAGLDRFRLLLGFPRVAWNQFQFHIRICQTVRIHRVQVPRFINCKENALQKLSPHQQLIRDEMKIKKSEMKQTVGLLIDLKIPLAVLSHELNTHLHR